MKYISGNLDNSSRDTIKNALAGGTGEAIEKRLPHIMTGDDENIDYLGESIFILHYDIEDTGEYTLYFNNILPKRVFLDSEEIDPSENIQPLTPGKHIVEVYSSRYWEEINEVLFDNLPSLKKIEFPRPLKRIGLGSVQNCSDLKTLVFERNLEELIPPSSGGYFSNCESLKEIQVSKRNRKLQSKEGKYIISRENNELYLSLDGTIPEKDVKSIQRGFSSSTEFEDLIIPNSVEIIGENAFEGCSFSGSLTFGAGLKRIQEKAFYNINIEGLESIEFKTFDPPIIDSPQYFDLRELDGNGNQISGIEVEEFYLPESISENWRGWSQYFNYFAGPRFQYFTIEAIENSDFVIKGGKYADGVEHKFTSLSYSLDNGQSWTTITGKDNITNTEISQTLSAGEKILIKGTGTGFTYAGSGSSYGALRINSTGKFNISGNIISLIRENNYLENSSLPEPVQEQGTAYALSGFFRSSTNLVSAENLCLPTQKLTKYCYLYLFQGCTSLTKPPKLPAKKLSENCYQSMFNGCTSLTTAPELPATTLIKYCYDNMFSGCSSLTTMPKLPAKILARNCYSNMFSGCTSLTSVSTTLPATTLEEECYSGMFSNCTSLTAAPALPALNLAVSCYGAIAASYYSGGYTGYGMFEGCSSLQTAPTLPASTLPSKCYARMFKDCTSLITAPELPATIMTSSCYYYMFYGCTSLTTAPELPAISPENDSYALMFYNCSSLNYVKALFLKTNTSYGASCMRQWLSGVSNSGTLVLNRGIAVSIVSSSGLLPEGWTIEYDPWPENYDYFTTEAIDNNCVFTFKLPSNLPVTNFVSISYSLDNGQTWVKTDNITSQEVIVTTPAVNSGSSVSWRGIGNRLCIDNNTTSSRISRISSTGRYNISGNILSLIGGVNSISISYYAFSWLFYSSTNLISAANLKLPTDTSSFCYYGMFEGCTALVNAPSLPATTLKSSCYKYMFYGCTSLTTAPALPATTLVDECYTNMFNSCSNLSYIKVMGLNSYSNGKSCVSGWLNGVASTGTAVLNSAAEGGARYGFSIPSRWTVQTASS